MKIKTQIVDLTLNNVPTIDDQDFIEDDQDFNFEFIVVDNGPRINNDYIEYDEFLFAVRNKSGEIIGLFDDDDQELIEPEIAYIRDNLIDLGFENADLYLASIIRAIGENLVYFDYPDDDLTLTQIANYVIDHPCNYPDELFINYVNELLQNFNLNPIVRSEIL